MFIFYYSFLNLYAFEIIVINKVTGVSLTIQPKKQILDFDEVNFYFLLISDFHLEFTTKTLINAII